jgi:hypothetical protein
MTKEQKILAAVSMLYCAGIAVAFVLESDWTARQTWAVALTGLVIIWYTYETMQLRVATFSQRELQLRPFVVLQSIDGLFQIENLGPGIAFNVSVDDVTINLEDDIRATFPEKWPILRVGQSKLCAVATFHGDANAADFFAANIEPEFANGEYAITIQFQNAEMKQYSVTEKVSPGLLAIQGLSSHAL